MRINLHRSSGLRRQSLSLWSGLGPIRYVDSSRGGWIYDSGPQIKMKRRSRGGLHLRERERESMEGGESQHCLKLEEVAGRRPARAPCADQRDRMDWSS